MAHDFSQRFPDQAASSGIRLWQRLLAVAAPFVFLAVCYPVEAWVGTEATIVLLTAASVGIAASPLVSGRSGARRRQHQAPPLDGADLPSTACATT